MSSKSEAAKHVEPYLFHGVDIRWQPGEENIYGECPFCGKSRKFSLDTATGIWHCFNCETGSGRGGGNVYTFLAKLFELCQHTEVDRREYEELAESRGYLNPNALREWGIVKSPLTGQWMVPGYNHQGKICNMYQWVKVDDRRAWLPTPGLKHQLFAATEPDQRLISKKHKRIYFAEGIWDAIAFYETASIAKQADSELVYAYDRSKSLLGKAVVLGIPSARVWKPSWTEICRGKEVVLLCQNDHDRPHPKIEGKLVESASYAGAKRAGVELQGVAESVLVHIWGTLENPFNPDLPHGFDIRDDLCLNSK